MGISLSKDSAKSLWKYVEAGRENVEQNWRPRLDRDRDLYLGDHWGVKTTLGDTAVPNHTGLSQVTVGVTGMSVDILHASQTYQKPTYDVQLLPEKDQVRDPSAERRLAIELSERITQDFEESRAWAAAQGALFDVYWSGNGWTLTGWHFGDEEPISREELQALGEDADYEQEMKGEGAVTIRVSPYDILIDPNVDAFNWEEAAWIGRRYRVEKEELEREVPRLKKRELNGITDPSSSAGNHLIDPAWESRPKNDGHPFIILYEIWFKRIYLERGYTETQDDGTTLHYPAGYYPLRVTWAADRPEEPIRCDLWPYDLRDARGRRIFPFDMMVNRPVPGQLKGVSVCEIAEAQQMELNLTRSQEVTAADVKARTKYMVDVTKMMTKDATKGLKSAEVAAIIPINGPVGPDVIQAVMPPPSNPEVQVVAEHALRDLNALTGVDEAAQGVAVAGAQTATEVNLIAAKSGTRAAKHDEKFETFLSSIARKQHQLRVQFEKIGDAVSVTIPQSLGGNGQAEYREIGPEHLVPANVKVVTGSTKLKNTQQEVQGIMQGIQVLAGVGLLESPGSPMGMINPRPLVERLLKALGVDNGDPDLYQPGEYKQQAMQQMAMQQQMMAAQAGAMMPGAPADPLQAGTEPGVSPQSPAPVETAPPEDLLAGLEGLDPAILEQLAALTGG